MQTVNRESESTEKMEETLHSIYDVKHAAGFPSIAKLAKASGYSQVEVKQWHNLLTLFIVKQGRNILRESISCMILLSNGRQI